jgi:hypothetical protein
VLEAEEILNMNKLLILPLVLITAACGGNDQVASGTFDDGDGNEGSYSVRGDDENSETVIKSDEGEVRISTGSKASADLPMGIAIYPDADVQSSISGLDGQSSGAMVVLKIDASQNDVIDFYRAQLKSKGIDIKTEVKAGDMQMIGGEGKNGEGVNISVTTDPSGGVNAMIIGGSGK